MKAVEIQRLNSLLWFLSCHVILKSTKQDEESREMVRRMAGRDHQNPNLVI